MRVARNVVIIAVAVLAVAAVVRIYMGSQYAKWNQRVEEVLEFAEGESARADSAIAEAEKRVEYADSVARVVEARAPIIRERIIRIREEPVPEDCEPVVAARDSVINDLLVENGQLQLVVGDQRFAIARYAAANLALGIANDSLVAVLKDRPIPPPRGLPEIRVGPQAGICMDGRACAGVGISLGWKVPLF